MSEKNYCNCELRNRQWDYHTGKCRTCGQWFDGPSALNRRSTQAPTRVANNCTRCGGDGRIPNPNDRTALARAFEWCPMCKGKGSDWEKFLKDKQAAGETSCYSPSLASQPD